MGRNSHYFKGKEENARKAENLYKRIENDQNMMKQVNWCVENSKIYSPEDKDIIENFIHNKSTEQPIPNIVMHDADTVTAIEKACEIPGRTNIAALNFASFKNPGGMFLKGSKAQEECLCHQSALYNILSRFPNYYEENRKMLNKSLYQNRAIYTPVVPFFNEKGIFHSDIITCAAPNKYAAQTYENVSEEENWYNLYNRIEFILDIAKINNVDILIVGAFGCGVFGQDPYEVAAIFKYLLNNKRYGFELVVFAIPYGTRQDNFIPFCEVLNNKITNIDNPRVRDLLKKC